MGNYIMIKIETHLHTAPSSVCAIEYPRDIARIYKAAGYSGIVVTNHLWDRILSEWQRAGFDPMKEYLRGYRDLKKEGGKVGLSVYLGAEVHLTAHPEREWPYDEYLLYGVTEEFLLARPDITEWDQARLYKECKMSGILVFQAHPFRDYCSPADPKFMDGVEVYNTNPRHNSFNDRALEWAKKNKKLMLSGSDFHMRGDEISGITVSDDVTDYTKLVKSLKDNNFRQITND